MATIVRRSTPTALVGGIRRVQLVEGDVVDAEGPEGAIAGLAQVLGAAVAVPAAARARHPALGRHQDPLAVTVPGPERAGDQPLVVPQLAVVEALGVRGVDERDAGIERGVNGADSLLLRRPVGDGKMHPAVADRSDLGCVGSQTTLLHQCRARCSRRKATSWSRTSK